MDAKQYVETITTFERYFKLFSEKEGQLRTTFEHGRISLEGLRGDINDDPTYKIRTKHGILCNARPLSSVPGHWSRGGTFLGRTVLNTWGTSYSLVLNNSKYCKYQHAFVIGNGYSAESAQYDELEPVTCIDDIESIVFQQSMLHDHSEEYGIACLHNAGLILKDLITFDLSLTSHLGSTEKTILGITHELKEYMKYVR